MRLILVPVADRPECARALETAFDLGRRLGSSISGCHMRPHRHSAVSMASAFADTAWRRKSTKTAPAAAKSLYRLLAEQHGYSMTRRAGPAPGALWAERVGSPDKLMAILGPVADLTIVSRPAKSGSVADMFMTAIDDFEPERDFTRYMKQNPKAQEWDDLMRTFQQKVPEAKEGEWWANMEMVFDLQLHI